MRTALVWGLSLLAVQAISSNVTVTSPEGLTVSSQHGAKTKCKILTMDYKTEGRTSINPSGLSTITSMDVEAVAPGSEACVLGDSYGFRQHEVWTGSRCRGQFRVCGEEQDSPIKCYWRMNLKDNSGRNFFLKHIGGYYLSFQLVKQLSDAAHPCTPSVTYGYDNVKMMVWLRNGCRGLFDLCLTAQKPQLFPKCSEVDMTSASQDGLAHNPEGIKDIRWISVQKQTSGPGTCLEQLTYGFDGEVAWAKDGCQAVLRVCGDFLEDIKQKKKDQLLHNMFGKYGQRSEEIEEHLNENNKKRYKDKCKCTAWGNPHFFGFDGADIHFQGTCSEYTLVRTTAKNLGDCAFDVTVEKERGNAMQPVSFVSKVHIRMYGKEITLGTDKLLLVDGLRKPVSYKHEDKFRVSSSGSQDLIFSAEECGITIVFGKNHRVKVTTSGHYSGHMEGLCGNCNQDEADDLLLANGTSPLSSDTRGRNAEIGNSWHVSRDSGGQSDSCSKPIVGRTLMTKSDPDVMSLESAKSFCEPLRDERGPFHHCIKQSGSSFLCLFEGCVIDVLEASGDGELILDTRCKAFETMAEECSKMGITVAHRQWTNCELPCPAHSEYFDYVPECQPTCADPEPEGECLFYTSPGCMCAKGYVLDGSDCVAPSQCGCHYRDEYIPTGDYAITDNCTKKHTCKYNEDTGKSILTTTDYACGKYAHCDREDGRKLCKCNNLFKGDGHKCIPDMEARMELQKRAQKEEEERIKREGKLCSATLALGALYERFDGRSLTFGFKGHCTYLLAATQTTGGTCDFSVMVKYEHREGHKKIGFARDIYIDTRDLLIELRSGNIVVVNGEVRPLPYENHKKGITVDFQGKMVELRSAAECDLKVSSDGNGMARINFRHRNGGDVLGLLGKCGGVEEYLTREGDNVEWMKDRDALIGNSWKVPNPVGVNEPKECPVEQETPQCTEEQRAAAIAPEECGRLLDPEGPFAECYATLEKIPNAKQEVDGLHEACQNDACAHMETEDWTDMRCTFNELMADLCVKHGIGVVWREENFCPMPCGPHSQYTPRMYGCQPSCLQPQLPTTCDREEMEGCECNQGFVLDKGQCVTVEECGCRNNDGDYVPVGSRYVSEDCTTVYECTRGQDGAELTSHREEHGQCHQEAICKLDQHHQPQCVCKAGFTGSGYQCQPERPIQPLAHPKPEPQEKGEFCLCKANGDPRVVQFDSGRLWVNDPCKYTLVKSEDKDCSFAVEMKTLSSTLHTHMSFIFEIDVKLPDCAIRMGQNLGVQAKMNPTDPFSELTITRSRQVTDTTWVINNSTGVFVHTQCGLVVLFDGRGEVTTTVPSKYARSTSGLCGNCDSDQGNDSLDRHGNKLSHYAIREQGNNAVARMHIVADDSSMPDNSGFCDKE